MEHEFFHAEGKTDMKTLRVTFPNFSKARKRVPVNNDHTAKIKKINIYLKKSKNKFRKPEHNKIHQSFKNHISRVTAAVFITL